MSAMVSVALVAAVALFVGWPLLRPLRSNGAPSQQRDDRIAALQKRKLEAYAAIKEAELDYRTGKMSEEDFRALEARYRAQAAAAIEELQRLAARARPPRPSSAAPRKQAGPIQIAFCPTCGQRVLPPGNFCGGCGRDLRELAA